MKNYFYIKDNKQIIIVKLIKYKYLIYKYRNK